MRNTHFLILLFFVIRVVGQDLPAYNGSRFPIESRVEFANISILNNEFRLDDSIRINSCIEIGKLLCEKEKRALFREEQYPRMYISLSIDKMTSMIVVDSVLNEIKTFGLLTILYKTKESSVSGYALRLLPVNEKKNEIFEQYKKYVPVYKINDCKKDEVIVENNTTKWITPPPPPPPAPKIDFPLDFIPKLSNDSIYDNKKVFVLCKKNNGFVINGSNFGFEEFNKLIYNIIREQKYIIVIETNENNTYDDYISLISLCYSNLYELRDNFSEQTFNFNVLTYTISDKECLRLLNYNR